MSHLRLQLHVSIPHLLGGKFQILYKNWKSRSFCFLSYLQLFFGFFPVYLIPFFFFNGTEWRIWKVWMDGGGLTDYERGDWRWMKRMIKEGLKTFEKEKEENEGDCYRNINHAASINSTTFHFVLFFLYSFHRFLKMINLENATYSYRKNSRSWRERASVERADRKVTTGRCREARKATSISSWTGFSFLFVRLLTIF